MSIPCYQVYTVIDNNLKLIRFNSKIVNSFINNLDSIIKNVEENPDKKIYFYFGENDEEVKFSKAFYDKLYETVDYTEF